MTNVPYDMIGSLAQWYAEEAEKKLEAMAREPPPGYVDPPPYEEMSWEWLAREAGFAAERIQESD